MSIHFSHFFNKINTILPQEAKYTEVLGSIALVPTMLYFRGKLPENMPKTGKIAKNGDFEGGERPKSVAIVGSRHNTRYGEEVAYDLAYKLAKQGVVIVSGLAYGIDSVGHRAAVDAGGTTVAVLGTPIDEIYPRAHTSLAREIVEGGGAIISEYASGSVVHPKTSFLERNRIISGLSDVVVIVEAAERSGTLNTAAHALAQGKDVFAVPGNINAPYSRGCNKLIAQGAYPYTEVDDVLRVLFPEEFLRRRKKLQRTGLIGDNDVETAILGCLGEGVRAGEMIMEKKKIPPEVFNQSITVLEIKGRVRALGANNWSLC